MKPFFKLDQITTVILFLLAFSSLLYSFEAIMSILMIASAVLLLALNIRRKSFFNPKFFAFYGSFIAITFLNFFYLGEKSSKNIADSFFIFIVPLFSIELYKSPFFIKNKKQIFLTFIFSCCLLSLFFIGFYIKDIPYHNYDWYVLRFRMEYFYKIHGTYISLWFGVAMILFYDFLLFRKWTIKFLIVFVILIVGILLFNSRIVIIGIFIVMILRLFTIKEKYNKKIALIALVLFSSIILLFSKRILDNFNAAFSTSVLTSERYTIAYCSCETASKSLLFGYDLNKIQSKLNNCYDRYYHPNLSELNFNCHSQYLDFVLKGGIFLVILFFLTIYFKIKLCIKNKDYRYLSITILFTLAFITENVLQRQYGIYIYAFCDIMLFGGLFVVHQGDSTNKIKEN
jgi:O-antigen ligase